MVAALVGLAAVPVAPASPASAATYFSISPATWAYVDSQAPRTAFVNRDTDARVGTTVERDGRSHTYRSYFTFDLARLRGATVHQADFYTSESAVNDCDAAAPVELWRTRSVTSRTTWRNQPAELEMIRSFDRGPGSGCPGYLGADVIVAVNEALARGDASVTFELRVARANETNPALGRRLDRPGLSFATNHPPTVAELSLVEPDRPCGTAAAPSTGNDSTQFRARAVDEDESDYLTATFALWEVGHFDERRT
ncbi:MAG TPA: DNRLRE domain-containing protein, partial [Micromonosporaceae bacterium]|nr:DNRLRE domain-containing protein [Micromonosporaceae bacterium]